MKKAVLIVFFLCFSFLMSKKRLSDHEKGMIDAYRAVGHGYDVIAKSIGRSKGAVQNYVSGRRNYGQYKSSARPKKISKRSNVK